ncbi:MAG: flagellar hook capping FlgD N-terminal domain-containing protein [Chthoniobacteraceae bacterium]
MPPITSSTSTNKTAAFAEPLPDPTRTTGSKTLGVQDFLKLITVQLTSQDPLKPMEDTQFISQMASFTSLEQMQTLSKDFAGFATQQKSSSAQDYLGKIVTIDAANGQVTGAVSKVSFKDGLPMLTVNGRDYDPADVLSITAAPASTASQTGN